MDEGGGVPYQAQRAEDVDVVELLPVLHAGRRDPRDGVERPVVDHDAVELPKGAEREGYHLAGGLHTISPPLNYPIYSIKNSSR